MHSFGFTTEHRYRNEDRGVDACFMRNGGVFLLELIAPFREKSEVSALLERQGSGLYHICYIVEDLEREVDCFREKRFIPISPIQDSPGILEGSHVCFLYNQNLGLIELLQLS